MLKRLSIFMLTMTLCFPLIGCETEIRPDSVDDGNYSTQNPMSSLEYSIYMNKQITVFANQISTRMLIANNSEECTYENEADLADESVKILQDVLDEVTVTQPSVTSEDDRTTTIQAMQSAVEHMEDYAQTVREGKSVTDFKKVFQNDFNALTGLANLYYQ